MDDEEYGYYFAVKCWETLENPIAIEDGSLPKPAVTNLFLLEHSKESYQLFAIASEEEYRLMAEINQAFDDLSAEEQPDKAVIYRLANQKAVLVSEGFLTVANDNGDILRKIPMRRFARSPRVEFNKIKKLIQ
jgi:hypothetical protein